MPVPSPRNSIRIARGNYADLTANATEIGEGELCFAIDQDKFYSKSGGALVAVGGGTSLYSIAQLGDVDPSGVVDGQVLVYSSSESKWVPADQTGGGGDVESVNGQTGAVVLVVSDLANDAGYITAAEAPVQVSDIPTNNNQLLNGAGYITAAEAPVQPGDVFSGDYNDLSNKPSIPSTPGDIGAATAAQGALADTAIQPGANVSELANDAGYITSADIPGSPVLSVNGETGEVVLDAADVGAIAPGQVNPVYFADQAAFPDATANHGAVAHSHADGAMYFAHGGTWNKLANASDIPTNVSELNNDVGYLTSETINNINLSILPTLP